MQSHLTIASSSPHHTDTRVRLFSAFFMSRKEEELRKTVAKRDEEIRELQEELSTTQATLQKGEWSICRWGTDGFPFYRNQSISNFKTFIIMNLHSFAMSVI